MIRHGFRVCPVDNASASPVGEEVFAGNSGSSSVTAMKNYVQYGVLSVLRYVRGLCTESAWLLT